MSSWPSLQQMLKPRKDPPVDYSANIWRRMTTDIFYGHHLLTFQVSSSLPARTRCCQHQYLVASRFYIFKFCFPGPILLLFLLDRIGRKKSFALCFLMFSLFVLPMYACLGRYVCALCFRTSLHCQTADARLCFLGWNSITITSLILITRAFINTSLQVCYVYTPEVQPGI